MLIIKPAFVTSNSGIPGVAEVFPYLHRRDLAQHEAGNNCIPVLSTLTTALLFAVPVSKTGEARHAGGTCCLQMSTAHHDTEHHPECLHQLSPVAASHEAPEYLVEHRCPMFRYPRSDGGDVLALLYGLSPVSIRLQGKHLVPAQTLAKHLSWLTETGKQAIGSGPSAISTASTSPPLMP